MNHHRVLLVLLTLLQIALVCPSAVGAHEGSHERIDRLTAAIAANPSTAVLYAERAAVYRDDGSFDEALDDYEQAILLDPVAFEFSIQLAQTLLEAGRLALGLDAIERFLIEQPEDVAARLVRARIFVAMGSHEQAARDFHHVLAATQKPSPDLILQFANAHAAAGNLKAAVSVLDHGSELLGPLMVFVERSISLEIELGRFESALARIDQMISTSPRKDRLLSRRGDILAAAGRTDEAALAYQEALDSLAKLPRRLREVPASRELATLLRSRLRIGSE